MIDEIKSNILKKYLYKTEIHTHTLPVSRCSEFYAEDMIKTYSEFGIDTIVLTNHFTPDFVLGKEKEQIVKEFTDAYHDLKKFGDEYGIITILAMELRFEENPNDYLIFGINEEDISRICDYVPIGLEHFYKEFKRDDILIIQAHPGRVGMTEMDPAYLDGMEAFNMHPGHNSRVALTAFDARKKGLIITGGTDLHHPGHEGCCILRTKTKIYSAQDIVKTLKSGDYAFDIGGSILLP